MIETIEIENNSNVAIVPISPLVEFTNSSATAPIRKAIVNGALNADNNKPMRPSCSFLPIIGF